MKESTVRAKWHLLDGDVVSKWTTDRAGIPVLLIIPHKQLKGGHNGKQNFKSQEHHRRNKQYELD